MVTWSLLVFQGFNYSFVFSALFFTFLGPKSAAAGSQGIYSPGHMQNTWLPVMSSYPPHIQCFMLLAIN